MLYTNYATTDRDLTTTGRVRNILLGAGATSTDQDAAISVAIRAASVWAESYVGFPLTRASYTETVASFGGRSIMVSRIPVVGVRRVYDSSDTGNATLLEETDFRVENDEAGLLSRDDAWVWSVPSVADLELRPNPGQEYKPWLVDYVAGYTYGGVDTGSVNWSTEMGTTSTGRTLPEDIEEAVAQRAAALISGDDDLVAESLGDLKVQYRSDRTDDKSMSLYELLLAPYRRMV